MKKEDMLLPYFLIELVLQQMKKRNIIHVTTAKYYVVCQMDFHELQAIYELLTSSNAKNFFITNIIYSIPKGNVHVLPKNLDIARYLAKHYLKISDYNGDLNDVIYKMEDVGYNIITTKNWIFVTNVILKDFR